MSFIPRCLMTYRGRIKNGVPVLETPVALPEGMRVRVDVEPAESEFWTGKTIEELARVQGVATVTNPATLVMEWPEDESIDDLMALVRKARH
jgi:hypothetical protein